MDSKSSPDFARKGMEHMAANKYSYKRQSGGKAKPILISVGAVVAVGGAVIGWMAYQANRENQIAALKYDFNSAYPKSFNAAVSIDPADDFDRDGLSNETEKLMNTSGSIADTDGDGIIDGEEEQYGTDPSNPDTDGDGIFDGIEILAGLDPLSAQSDSSTPDAERKFTRKIEFDEGYVTLSGNADIFGATVEKLSLYSVASNAGAFSFPYEIYCKSPFDSAEITFRCSPGLLAAAGLTTDDIHIYRFDPRSKTYSNAGGTVAGESEITGTTDSNGVFLIGAEHVVNYVIDENTKVNIHLLIDNSGSMYPSNAYYASEENDTEFKRLSFAENLVSKLNNNTDIAITIFTAFTNTLCEFTDNKEDVMAAIEQIRTIGADYDGTSVERTLMNALKSFPEESQSERNIIVLLTDGISTETGNYTIDTIIDSAQAKNVTVMTISLGNDIDRALLQEIADRTGGKYFPISEANALEGLYSTLIATMENDIVDEDDDGTPDTYSLFDTGFKIEENGFKFSNFKTLDHGTSDFGMTMLARDWFKGNVKTKTDSYDLSKTAFSLNEPLSKVILACMSDSYITPDNYLNFREGELLEVDEKILKEAQGKGWFVREENFSENKNGWKKVQYLVPRYNGAALASSYSENDVQILRLIDYCNSLRDTGESFALSDESDLNRVKNILGSGTPMLMKMIWEENGVYQSRYVDLIALRRDMDNPNLFNLKIYDPNFGYPTKVTLNRTMVCDPNSSDSDYTYSANWDGKQVAIEFYLTEAE